MELSEREKRDLITHIKNESLREPISKNDEFENALFEAKVREILGGKVGA